MSGARLLAIAALTLLAACASTARLSAADDIHAFLIAIRDDDKAGFNAHVDRPALTAELRDKLVAGAMRQDAGLGALAAAIGAPLADIAVDKLVQPEVFRVVAESAGYSPDKPLPGALQIAESLRTIDLDHVCVARTRTSPCIFIFTDEDGAWRLTSIEADPALFRKLLKG